MICPLCLKRQTLEVVQGPDDRLYRNCSNCNLIFTETRLTAPGAAANSPKQENKLAKNAALMKKAAKVAKQILPAGSKGLCIGAGIRKELQTSLSDAGLEYDVVDANYLPKDMNGTYDFIIAVGTLENYFFPAKEIKALNELLNTEGKLIVISELWQNLQQFSRWTYAKEKNHVAFYHMDTFKVISEKYGFEIREAEEVKVLVLEKKVEQEQEKEEEEVNSL